MAFSNVLRFGLDKEIKKAVNEGVGYCGISAGSIMACPTIETAGWKHADGNIVRIKDLHALNLVPFLITVHFSKEVMSAVQAAARKTSFPVVAINDHQAVVIHDDFTQIVGTREPSFIKWAKQ